MFVDFYCLTCLRIFGMFDEFSREDLEELLLKSGLKYLLYMDMYEFMCNFSYFLVCDQCQPTSFKKTHMDTFLTRPLGFTKSSNSSIKIRFAPPYLFWLWVCLKIGETSKRPFIIEKMAMKHEVQFGFGGT